MMIRGKEKYMGKLRSAVCPGCRKAVARHDNNRYEEMVTQYGPRLTWHLVCHQKAGRRS